MLITERGEEEGGGGEGERAEREKKFSNLPDLKAGLAGVKGIKGKKPVLLYGNQFNVDKEKFKTKLQSTQTVFRARKRAWLEYCRQPGQQCPPVEITPDWMYSWKPHQTKKEDVKLNNNLGALLITGVELHLVPQGNIADPDLNNTKGGSRVISINDNIEMDFGRVGCMLMCMRFKSPIEAKRRAALIMMKTFDIVDELFVPVMTYGMLRDVWRRMGTGMGRGTGMGTGMGMGAKKVSIEATIHHH